jgi:hypothetical protein
MFLSKLKKTVEETKALHRFIYENTPFYEDSGLVDQKNYNFLQVNIFRKIAKDKFGGDISKFMTSPDVKKIMELYREYVKQNLPFLLTSNNNPTFDFKDENIINHAAQFIMSKVYPVAKTMAARG